MNTAQKLYDIQQQIKALQAVEKDLKSELKESGDGSHLFGDYVVKIDTRIRTSLDKKALVADFGDVITEKYQRETPYQTLSVALVKGKEKAA